MAEAIQIFIGCAANNEDLESQAVLDYTLHKYASKPLAIHWMQLSRHSDSWFYCEPEKDKGWVTDNWATPFSGFRWVVPQMMEFTGRAIYMDSDFIVRADIVQLWDKQFEPGKAVIASHAGRLDCCLWNCEIVKKYHYRELDWLMREANSHRQMIAHYERNARAVQLLSPEENWNAMDIMFVNSSEQINAPAIKAIHYTSIPTQLQLKYAVPRLKAAGLKHWYEQTVRPHPCPALQELFDEELAAASQAGFLLDNYVHQPYGKYSIRGSAHRAA